MNSKIKSLFAASLALNMLLAGVLIGTLSHRLRPPPPPPPPPPSIEQALKQLPPEKQQSFRDEMESLRKLRFSENKERREQQEKLREIFTAETFDAAAYDTQIKVMTEQNLSHRLELAQAMKKLASGWTQEERKALADIIRRPPPPEDGMPGRPGRFRHGSGGENFPPRPDDGPPPPPDDE